MEYNLFKETRGFFVFFVNISNLKAGMGGTLMSLYTESQKIKLLYIA